MPQTEYAVGQRITLTVGEPAHGGHCVSRFDGLVVFVRHALPGEQVLAEVTEVRRGYLRADAVQVFTAAADRVAPPCPYARPGGCGGCDLQHASAAAQLSWKAAVVREQLQRLAGLSTAAVDALDLSIAPLPGGLLGWRTRMRHAVADGQAGMRAHRSHRVVAVDQCLLAHPAIRQAGLTTRTWPEASAVEASTGSDGAVQVRVHQPAGEIRVQGPDRIRQHAVGRRWWLPGEVFWQGHPAAADTLAGAVCELLAPVRAQRCWDLYGGAGLFAAALATAGADAVTLVESDATAVSAAGDNLADLPVVSVRRGRVATALRRRQLPAPVDLVVLDPPRAGAGADVVAGIVAAGPRAVAYVACDPAAFARDVAAFGRAGWALAAVRGFDCFPMTQHVELVGLLRPAA